MRLQEAGLVTFRCDIKCAPYPLTCWSEEMAQKTISANFRPLNGRYVIPLPELASLVPTVRLPKTYPKTSKGFLTIAMDRCVLS